LIERIRNESRVVLARLYVTVELSPRMLVSYEVMLTVQYQRLFNSCMASFTSWPMNFA
jgi:hypothetical protein